jgi:negative regulator of flagellin synthesis FlgM
MKIDGQQGASQTNATSGTAQTAGGHKAHRGHHHHAGGADRVDVSDDARLRADALKAANDAPGIRQDKVDAAKQKLADGTLGADAGALADSLIDDLLEQ